MCEPTTILAAQLAMTGVQHYTAQQAAVDKANRQNALYTTNAANAQTALTGEYRNSNNRSAQENKSTAQKKFDKTIEGMKARSKVIAASGSSNTSGRVIQTRLNQVTREEGTAKTRLDTNNRWKQQEIENQKASSQVTFKNRVNSVEKGYAPSAGDALMGMFLDMGMQVAGHYAMQNSLSQTPNPTGATSYSPVKLNDPVNTYMQSLNSNSMQSMLAPVGSTATNTGVQLQTANAGFNWSSINPFK